MHKHHSRRATVFLSVALFLLLVGAWLCYCLFNTRSAQQKSVVLIERATYYDLLINDKQHIYFKAFTPDSTLSEVSADSNRVAKALSYSNGCWFYDMPLLPICNGKLLVMSSLRLPAVVVKPTDLQTLLQKTHDALSQKMERRDAQCTELKYYLDTHNVQDEGYDMIVRQYHKVKAALDSLRNTAQLLSGIKSSDRLSLQYRIRYGVLDAYNPSAKRKIECRVLRHSTDYSVSVLQTNDKITPDGMHPIHLLSLIPRFSAPNDLFFTTSVPNHNHYQFSTQNLSPVVIPTSIRTDGSCSAPDIALCDGAPVFSSRGVLYGFMVGGKLLNLRQISRFSDEN